MTVEPRNNLSPDEVVNAYIDRMTEAGWEDLGIRWDADLRVWRAEGSWKSQQREGRGSTPELALSSLNTLTPNQ